VILRNSLRDDDLWVLRCGHLAEDRVFEPHHEIALIAATVA
jgi:hypothetical protein